MTGPIPSEYGELSKLEILDISSNTLTGSIPESFTALSNINDFRVGQNKLRGKILPKIEPMHELRHIDIKGCLFEDDGLSQKIQSMFPSLEGLLD